MYVITGFLLLHRPAEGATATPIVRFSESLKGPRGNAALLPRVHTGGAGGGGVPLLRGTEKSERVACDPPSSSTPQTLQWATMGGGDALGCGRMRPLAVTLGRARLPVDALSRPSSLACVPLNSGVASSLTARTE